MSSFAMGKDGTIFKEKFTSIIIKIVNISI